MKAAVWYGKRDLRIEEVEEKPLKDTDVKVKVAWAGICGSDLHEYEEGPVFVPTEETDPLTNEKAPLTMGHEFAGVVEEVGNQVKKFRVGDRVTINPTITYGSICNKCSFVNIIFSPSTSNSTFPLRIIINVSSLAWCVVISSSFFI